MRAEDLDAAVVRVADVHGAARRLPRRRAARPAVVELKWLFVAPAAMGRGPGRALLADAVSIARRSGARALRIESDPNAVGLLPPCRCATGRRGPVASIPGRALPLLELAVG